MKTIVLAGVVLFALTGIAAADQAVQEAQRVLKEQGFYYGEATGVKDAETVAAIRRYQIRSGLEVTGDLNAETTTSLHSAPAASATPRAAAATPKPAIRDLTNANSNGNAAAPEEEPVTGEQTVDEQQSTTFAPQSPPITPARPSPTTIFAGTPYAGAPAEVQREVVSTAQSMLARRGYYRGPIDGAYGPSTEFALRAYQSQLGVQPSGTFDMETLASLRLLPGERNPQRVVPRRPYNQPPVVRGEWIHE